MTEPEADRSGQQEKGELQHESVGMEGPLNLSFGVESAYR